MEPRTASRRRQVRSGRNHYRRNGAAVVELAVCLPIILLIGLGCVQAASMLFLRQAMVQSAYEAVKVAVANHGTIADATSAATRVAAGRRVNDLQVEFQPANISTVQRGQLIRVIVSAPSNSNTVLPFGVLQNQRVIGSAAMVKE